MSIGSSLSGISFAGLGSGIDTNSIVERLMSLEQIPIRRLQQRQAQLTERMGIYNQLRSRVQALSSAANSLNSPSAYNPARASASDASVATIAASSGAVEGSYTLKVSQLAQTHKLGSSAHADTSTALGLAGVFKVNGKEVTVVASDSLAGIAQKINSAGGNVVASLIDGGAGQAYMTLTSAKSGLKEGIGLQDISGDVLGPLGFTGTALRHPITGGAATYGLASQSSALGSLLNLGDLTTSTVSLGTGSIEVTSSDTLQTLATKINAAGVGATATVASETVDGLTTYRLEVTGTTSFGAEGDFWLNLGVLKRSNEIVAAQDAKFKLDNVHLSSATNTVTTVIPNVTLTLLKGTPSSPETTTLSITRDTEQTKKSIKGFVDAYNQLVDFIQQNSKFDQQSYSAGPLFGDTIAAQVETAISGLLFDSVSNTGGSYSNLAQIGFSFDDKGKITLDENVLDAAIVSNISSLGALMRATGSTTVNDLVFVAGGSATRPSGPSGYAVEITQIATKTHFAAAMAQTQANAGGEVLTFSGTLFSSEYQLAIPTGHTVEQTRDLINSDSKLKDLVSAEVVGGKLEIRSKVWGSAGRFEVASNQEAAAYNSGVGTSEFSGTLTLGLDVAGTINGQAATGSGQFLTGASSGSNKDADGLQIQYKGTTTGLVGNVIYTKGVAAKAIDLIATFTDSVNGLLSSTDKSLQSQFDDLGANVTTLQSRLSVKEVMLRQRFAAMDAAIAQLQQQQTRLQSMMQRQG